MESTHQALHQQSRTYSTSYDSSYPVCASPTVPWTAFYTWPILLTNSSAALSINFIFKLYKGLVNLDFHSFFQLTTNKRTRGHTATIFCKFSKNNYRRDFFTVSSIDLWNSLPQTAIDSPNLVQFNDFSSVFVFRPLVIFTFVFNTFFSYSKSVYCYFLVFCYPVGSFCVIAFDLCYS